MTDIRRMNVGLTRAKSSLWILGDSRALVQGEFWRKLIQDAQARDRYTQGDIVTMFRKPLERAKPGSYTQPALPAPPSLPAPPQDREVVMRDAPLRRPSPPVTTAKSASPAPIQPEPPQQIPGLGPPRGAIVQEAIVPRSGGPPVIHTSSSKPPGGETKKRAHDTTDSNHPGAKRIASDRGRGGLMGKFGQKPPRAPKLPTDPSAMSVLGMTPPDRPLPIPTAPYNAPTGPAADKNKSMRPLPPPGPRKKGKPSLFVPKKR